MSQTAWLKRLTAMLRALLQRGQAMMLMRCCSAVQWAIETV